MGEISDALRHADRAERTRRDAEPSERAEKRRPTHDLVDSMRDETPQRAPERRSEPRVERRRPLDRDPSRPAEPESPPPARRTHVLQSEGEAQFSAARITLADPLGPATQQYRRLAFRIRELAEARKARSIVVTSARPLDGKTTTACNLAIQLARLDQAMSVVLVDLDLRRAGVAASFGIDPEVPVDAVLRGKRTLDEAVLETNLPGLSVLALKKPAPDPEWLLALPSLQKMIADLERRFDFVIIDTPPVLATSDAQVVLRHAAAGLFIARMGMSPVKAVRRALEHIQVGKLLGSVLNASRSQQGLADYPYYAHEVRTDDSSPSSEEAEPSDEQ